jgi:hypothetical protein
VMNLWSLGGRRDGGRRRMDKRLKVRRKKISGGMVGREGRENGSLGLNQVFKVFVVMFGADKLPVFSQVSGLGTG